jgi:hypothetical protein
MERTYMRHGTRLVALAAIVAAAVSCGDVIRQGRSPVYLVIDSLQARQGRPSGQLGGTLNSDVLTIVTSPAPCTTASPCAVIFNDIGSVSLRSSLKDIIGTTANPAAPTTNNDVTINRYRVSYRRADGRNTPGVDVPYGFDGATTVTIPAGGSASASFEIVRHVAKEESPLVQLINSPVIISTITDVTFYGHDQVGNEISVTGSILIDFGNFGDI